MTPYNNSHHADNGRQPGRRPTGRPDNGYEMSARERRNSRTRRIVKWLWISFLSLGFIIFMLLLLIYNGIIGYMPPIDELEDPHDNFASILYAADGKTELGRYYEVSANRENIDYKEISPYVIDALIATEDIRFMSHSGIDFQALGRTGIKTVLLGDKKFRRRLYHNPAAGQDSVLAPWSQGHETRPAKAYRMDDSHQARARVYKRGVN